MTNFVSVKLDGNNYAVWRDQVVCVLVFEGLMGYVDGSVSAPAQIITAAISSSSMSCLSELILNPEYVVWRQIDQQVISLLHATLHPSVLSDVVGCASSKALWDALSEMFAYKSRPESDKDVVLSALSELGL